MTGQIITADGAVYELPRLLSYELCLTGSVPCDSFSVCCAYAPEMAETLRGAYRFHAVRDGETAFCGVVDDYTVTHDGGGSLLTVMGRGMAALLLDNEALPAIYQCATTEELIRNHVTPYGIVCEAFDRVTSPTPYTVSGGSSEWKVLDDFLQNYGGFAPCFTACGALRLCRENAGKTLQIDETAPLLSVTQKKKRYGVVSEAVVIDRKTGRRSTVRNEAFAAAGGRCRRVIGVPADATGQKYTAEYQIAQSQKDAGEYRIEWMGFAAAEPADRVELSLARCGIQTACRVAKTVHRLDDRGETTVLTLREE